MAQFRATIQGQRGNASRLGGKASGIHAHVNAWHLGVDVDGSHDAKTDCDRLRVDITGGSSRGEPAYEVIEIRNTAGVLTGFIVSEKPAEVDG